MMPFGMANRGSQYLRRFFTQSAGVFLPADSADQQVRGLRQQQPLHEAELGVSAIHRGEYMGQKDLMLMGSLIIANSVYKADVRSAVPDAVTARVVDIALEEEIYPEVNPYLSEPILDRTAMVLKKFDHASNVFQLFPHA